MCNYTNDMTEGYVQPYLRLSFSRTSFVLVVVQWVGSMEEIMKVRWTVIRAGDDCGFVAGLVLVARTVALAVAMAVLLPPLPLPLM